MAWTYLLECSDGTYYVGSTVELQRRVAQHEAGLGAPASTRVAAVVSGRAVRRPSSTTERRGGPLHDRAEVAAGEGAERAVVRRPEARGAEHVGDLGGSEAHQQ